MKKFLKFSLGMALSLSLFVVQMPSVQAADWQAPTIEAKGDKPTPVPPKPFGPPKSEGE